MTTVVEPHVGVITVYRNIAAESNFFFCIRARMNWNQFLLTVGVFITNRFICDQKNRFSSPLNLLLLLEFFLIRDFAYEAS